MKVWIDLSNSPHPLLFAPVARRLEDLGHEVGVTARDNAQTAELTIERWPSATIIGGESPKSRAQKARVIAARVRALTQWAGAFRPDVALSHNSYSQIVAARMRGLRVVTAMDYEGQPANHLAFRLASVILMPAALRYSGVSKQGATHRRTRFYAGFKEEMYLGDFQPDPAVLTSLGIKRGVPLVVLRTPPSRATYHRFGNELFGRVVEILGIEADPQIVVLVRHSEQRERICQCSFANLVVPDHAIDSRSLMYHADLVVGAGGTMTREAALMGVPTYSAFVGDQPAVDRQLEREGRLQRLEDPKVLIPVRQRAAAPRPIAELRARAADLVETVVDTTITSARVKQ